MVLLMRTHRRLLILAAVSALAACAPDRATVPAPQPRQPTARELREYSELVGMVASHAEAYARTHSAPDAALDGLTSDEMRKRVQALTAMAAEMRRRGREAEEYAMGRRSGPVSNLVADNVAAGGSIFDVDGTFSWINIDGGGKAEAFTHLKAPAQIAHTMSINISGSSTWAFSDEQDTGLIPTTGYYSSADLPFVACFEAAATGTVSTQHKAGWTVAGLGLQSASMNTHSENACDPQHLPCYQMPRLPGMNGGGGVLGGPNDNGYSDAYDPYASGSDCSDTGGDGSIGSGIQFVPGDYTGGETVGWSTGIGNGGASACGLAAQVEYVCVEVLVGTEWKDWGCGYVTTC
ncbi:MAG: hypothetical protein JWM27_4238 [Gemmatimonadetes bacterium]|nr:hypothetical protein [Gemmatimonadota bacterium]